ncbi:MAG: amidase domain-containing protein [Paenibacillaceae bacterium]|nr:amidase domain-containing protein [Paenibacillaceae bacterium]
MSWKSALYDYVHDRNERALGRKIVPAAADEYDGDRPLGAEDEAVFERIRAAARRRAADRGERGLKPVRHETRLRVLRVEAGKDAVTALIELRQLFRYESFGQTHEEERAERERVELTAQGGKWRVRRIAPLGDEADAAAFARNVPARQADGGGGGLQAVYPPLPYLNRDVLYSFETGRRKTRYDRQAAVQYADRWWNSYNPQFEQFEVDCTNYVSQCIYAGNAPMNYTGKRDLGWWYRGLSGGQELWSYSWAVANSLQLYLRGGGSAFGLQAAEVDSPAQLTLGDVICYSWDGVRFGHNTFVTAMAPDGMPLVNAHTVNSRHRYWDYRDSYAWTERTKYRFFHIADYF